MKDLVGVGRIAQHEAHFRLLSIECLQAFESSLLVVPLSAMPSAIFCRLTPSLICADMHRCRLAGAPRRGCERHCVWHQGRRRALRAQEVVNRYG